MKYVLDGKTPVACNDLYVWAEFIENGDRIVAKTEFAEGVIVSTVFLGLDQSFSESPIPVLFETKIFGGCHDDLTRQYTSWDAAELGHQEVVSLLNSWYTV
jgi:autonomous glycyl radical cofactor GrcA